MRLVMTQLTKFVSSYWGVVGVFVAWALAVQISGLNTIVVPGPRAVLADLWQYPTVYFSAGFKSLTVAAAGLVVGVSIGSMLAALCWFSPILRGMISPVGFVLASVPVVALIPIIVRLLGNGQATQLAIVSIIIFFPAFVFASTGFTALPPGSEDLFKVLGAKRTSRFRFLALPASFREILVAIRICAPTALLSAMTAEFLIGSDGLGYLLRSSASRFEVQRVFGTALLSAAFAIAMTTLVERCERKLLRRRT